MIYFTPGPSKLYPSLSKHISDFLDTYYPYSLPTIIEEANKSLRAILEIPDTHQLFFISSGTEGMERSIQNVVERSSFHCIQGTLSQRYYNFAKQLGKESTFHLIEEGQGIVPEDIQIPEGTEAICVTHCETSTGVLNDLNDIYKLKEAAPEALLIIDAVTSLPYAILDWQKVDCSFFSVQKVFSLLPGLCVMIVGPEYLRKSKKLVDEGISVGSYHSAPVMDDLAKNFLTIEAANTLAIYVLGRVAAEMEVIGIERIRRDIDQRAELLYSFLEGHEKLSPFVTEKRWRSPNVIAVEFDADVNALIRDLQEDDILVGGGMDALTDRIFRVANFASHNESDFKRLFEVLNKILEN